MGHGVAYQFKNLSAAMVVVPPLAMRTPWIITLVHILLPSGLAGIQCRNLCRLTYVGELRLIAFSAEGAIEQLHMLTRPSAIAGSGPRLYRRSLCQWQSARVCALD